MSNQYPTNYRAAHTPAGQPSKRKQWTVGVLVVAGIALGAAACGPEDDSAEANRIAGFTATAPTTAASDTLPPSSPDLPGVADYAASAVYGDFLEENRVPISEADARRTAQAACSVMNDLTYPGAENFEATAYGTMVGAQAEYPELSDDDAAAVIGGGMMVYCPTMAAGL